MKPLIIGISFLLNIFLSFVAITQRAQISYQDDKLIEKEAHLIHRNFVINYQQGLHDNYCPDPRMCNNCKKQLPPPR
jgi:hypothetical protein